MNHQTRETAKRLMSQFTGVIGILAFICFFSSCVSSKNLKYFNNLSDSAVTHLPAIQKPLAVIMPDDLLEIKIAGANEATAALLNTYSISANPSNATSAYNYLVDDNGEIEFPVVGKIKAAGVTKEELKEIVKLKVAKFLKDPLVSVRFTNFRFTVLGEVKMPGSFLVQKEKVTVLEALGTAGDMTAFSRRDKVRIIRDSSGTRETGLVDFTDKSVFTSRYYYLQRNDVIYIEAEKSKSQYESFSRVTAIVATLASLIAIAITVLK